MHSDRQRGPWPPWVQRALAAATGCYGAALLYASHHPRPGELLAEVSTTSLPSDKLLHLACYGVLGLLAGATLVAYRGRSARRAAVLGCVLAGIGAASEVFQPLSGRDAEFLDWLADVAGIAAGIAVAVRYAGVAWPRWLPLAVLAVVAGGMLAAAQAAGQAVPTADATAHARPGPPAAAVAHAIDRLRRACGTTFLLGLVTPLGLAELVPSAAGRWRPIAWAGWLAVAGAVVAGCLRLAWNHWPGTAAIAIATLPATLGIVLGGAARGGWRRLALAAAVILAGLATTVAAAVWLGTRLVASAPLAFEPVILDQAEKLALVRRLRDARPAPDEPRILRFSDREVAGLVNGMLLRAGRAGHARVELTAGRGDVALSVAVPRPRRRRYLNLRACGAAEIAAGRLRCSIDRLEVGGVAVPAAGRWLAGGAVDLLLHGDPGLQRVLHAVYDLALEPGGMEVMFNAAVVGQDIVPSLVQFVWQRPDVAAETRLYLEHLDGFVRSSPRGPDRFAQLVEEAFRLARDRSVDGDPAQENRAAILALAIAVGHAGVEPLVGVVSTPEAKAERRRLIGPIRLRGRGDWAQHFLVSAALELLSGTVTSDAMGLFKEQADAREGGSGFSFADLLANLAGIRFAEAATSPAGARTLQERLAAGFVEDDFFPSAADLPEWLSADELQRVYGGIDGPGYRRVMKEIHRRLEALPAVAPGRRASRPSPAARLR